MLQKQKTKEEFGYTPDELTAGSSKSIILECDYCNKIFNSTPKRRKIAHKDIVTDCCKSCKYKKREEVSLKKYGVVTICQRGSLGHCCACYASFGSIFCQENQ